MPTEHTIPSSIREPGTYHEFDLLSAAQGITPLQARVLGIGVMGAGGTAVADVAVQVFSDAEADTLFVKGSEAALLARIGLLVGRLKGISPEIWITPIADPAGTAAIHRLTVTAGTAAEAGDIVFRIAGRTIRAGVSKDDDEIAVAIAIANAVTAHQTKRGDLPVTAAVLDDAEDNKVDLTAICTGVNGNDIDVEVLDVGLTGLVVTASTPTPGVGVADPEDALAASLAKFFETKALMNHATADADLLVAHLAEAWAPASKRWCFAFLGETGSLATATALAEQANDFNAHVIGYEDSPSLPGEIAMAVATAVALRARPNYNWDGDELPLYAPPDASVWTSGGGGEIESALAAGVTPLRPNDARTETLIVRLVNTASTVDSVQAPEETKDLAPIRAMLHVTRDLDAHFERQFGKENKSPAVLKQMRSVGYKRLKDWEGIKVLQNVDAHFGKFKVEQAPGVPTRALIHNPVPVVPNLHQRAFLHTLIVE